MKVGNAREANDAVSCADADDWPRIIHRMWRAAQVERKRLVIDLVGGDCFVIGTGTIATPADIV